MRLAKSTVQKKLPCFRYLAMKQEREIAMALRRVSRTSAETHDVKNTTRKFQNFENLNFHSIGGSENRKGITQDLFAVMGFFGFFVRSTFTLRIPD